MYAFPCPFSMQQMQEHLPKTTCLHPEEVRQIVYDYFLHEPYTKPQYYMKEIVYEIAHREVYPDELHLAKRLYDFLRRHYSILDSYLIELVLCMGHDPQELEARDILVSFELDTHLKLESKDYWMQVIQRMIRQLEQDMSIRF